jgi:hypothetical protein
MIALAPGAYTVINARGGERYQASVAVAEGKVSRLQRGDLASVKQDYGRKKGVLPHGLDFGVAAGCGGAHFNVAPTAESLAGLFGDVREAFAMDPQFTITDNLATLLFQVSMRYKNRIELYLGMGMYSTASTASFTGYQINPFDSVRYGAALAVEHSSGLEFRDFGVGYLFQQGILKNGSVHAGLSSFRVNLSASGTFTDSLHHATSGDQDHTLSGETLVPYGAVGYELPLSGWASLCSSIRLRAAPADAQISGIRWDLRGIDGNVVLRLNLSYLARELLR